MQTEDPDSLAKVPDKQLMQDLEFVSLYVPEGQSEHTAAAEPDAVPARQSLQAQDLDSLAFFPGKQSMHVFEFSPLYVPGRQSKHTAAAGPDIVPAGQPSQVQRPSSSANLPSSHSLQMVCPSNGWTLPLAHRKQLSERMDRVR